MLCDPFNLFNNKIELGFGYVYMINVSSNIFMTVI